ncbi:MAG: 5-formyltetrahydrofolate cyclo-ligase [Lachnospiraceae bacterium]|nr:5-formyltetrahydrofolate cyclo-ligase [Lachnospiraceae bacterium]
MNNKKIIRNRILKLRSSLTQLDVMRCSRAVIDRVFESEEYVNATSVYIYFETEKEISTHAIMKKAWKDGKKVAVPLCIGERMEFIYIDSLDSVMPGFKGIYEPFEGEVADAKEVLMIMPGLAYDRSFNRIGYGGGYYDRYVSEHPDAHFTLMALGYDFQIVEDDIGVNGHDVPVDIIVTPKNCYRNIHKKQFVP